MSRGQNLVYENMVQVLRMNIDLRCVTLWNVFAYLMDELNGLI